MKEEFVKQKIRELRTEIKQGFYRDSIEGTAWRLSGDEIEMLMGALSELEVRLGLVQCKNGPIQGA